jgi:L-malate glycosyltransferase
MAPELRDADLVIVEQSSRMLLNYRLLIRQSLGGARVAFWGHGRSFASRPSRVGEAVKRWSSRRAAWMFAHTLEAASSMVQGGVDPTRMTVVDNSIDTTALREALAAVSDDDLRAVREDLELGDGPVGLFLGNLRDSKRLDVLLAASERIAQVEPRFHLLVVGSGPAAEAIQARTLRSPWLRYVGPRYGAERAPYLGVADVLLLPAAVGLVIIDSFVAAIPLVTSAKGDHGPELAYVRDGENAILVPGRPDPERYAAEVVRVLRDPVLLDRLEAACLEDAARYSIEGMASRFAEGIRRALPSVG